MSEEFWKDRAGSYRARAVEAEAGISMLAVEINALRARLAEAERDAARYRWLRTRINWSYQETRVGNLHSKARAWTHYDYRENPPASDHIDEYIDGEIAGRPVNGEGGPNG